MSEQPIRYSKIEEKNLREILMLRGRSCAWKREVGGASHAQ